MTTPEPKKSKNKNDFESVAKRFKEDPDGVLRVCRNIYHIRKLLDKPKLTHEQFCDLKINVLTKYWQEVKKNPSLLSGSEKAPKVPKPENEEKIRKRLEKAQKTFERSQKQLELLEQAQEEEEVTQPSVPPAPKETPQGKGRE